MKPHPPRRNGPGAKKFHSVAKRARKSGASHAAAQTAPQATTRATAADATIAARQRVRLIETDADVREGIEYLLRACPAMRRMHAIAGEIPLRRNAAGFAGLARIIVGQQVSVASANAIWARFLAVAEPLSAASVASLTDEQFRLGGLSRPKVRTLRAIAAAVQAGLDLDALAEMDEEEARASLTAISGIGPWTADIYLMFCLGRADVFASGDLALQEAARLALDLEVRPKADVLASIAAERWRPWRAVAARMLWAYYAATRSSGSGQPV